MEHFVVEREFEEPMTAEAIRARARRGAWCFDQYAVRYLRGYLSPDGLRMVCLFAAPDMEAIRRANETVGMPVTRIWPTTIHEPA